MHAHQHGLLRANIALDDGDVGVAFNGRLVGVQLEVTMLSREVDGAGGALDQDLLVTTVSNEVSDGDDLQIMMLSEWNHIVEAHHRAVLIQNLTSDSGSFEPGELAQIYNRLRMPGSNQNSTFFSSERNNVPRSPKVARLRIIVNKNRRRQCPVSSRDAGGCSVNRVNRLCHGGAVASRVLLGHHRNPKLSKSLGSGRDKRNAAPVANHEVHDLSGAGLGGNHQIPFILAVGVIDHNYHLALLQFFKGFGD